MLFSIWHRSADTCGNESYTCLGYCQFPSETAAKLAFPRGFLGGYGVERVTAITPRQLRAVERKLKKQGQLN